MALSDGAKLVYSPHVYGPSVYQQHYFDDELEPIGPVSHVRLSIYPDGGISRVRLFGKVNG